MEICFVEFKMFHSYTTCFTVFVYSIVFVCFIVFCFSSFIEFNLFHRNLFHRVHLLDVSYTHLVVGAYGAGKAFIFKKDGSGDFPTTATAIITAYMGELFFGFGVALSDTHLVVGASGAQKASIFKKDGSGDFPTTATASITAYNESGFGVSVAVFHLIHGNLFRRVQNVP